MPAAHPLLWSALRVDDRWIHYRAGGPVDAPAMIHVHGFAISGTYLAPTAALLTDRFRVYVPDLPGFGRSPKQGGRFGATPSIEELATDLIGFMDALEIDQAILVGNSLGCAIIAELATQAPHRVRLAVLVGLAGGRHNQPLVRAIGQMALDGLREPPRLITVAAPDYLRFGMVRALRLFRWMTRFPAYDRLVGLGVPTMVVIGSEDPLRPSWRRIRAALNDLPPQMSLVVLEGAAHAINYSHPRELAHAIGQFVAGEPITMEAAHADGLPVLELKRPR